MRLNLLLNFVAATTATVALFLISGNVVLTGVNIFVIASMSFMAGGLVERMSKKQETQIVPADRDEAMRIVEELKEKNPETMKLLGK